MARKIILTDENFHWHDLIHEAAYRGQIQLPAETYVFIHHLLQHLIHTPDFYCQDLTIFAVKPHHQQWQVAEAADNCLLLLGLFPNRLAKFHIDPSFIVDTGQTLYSQLDYHPKFMPQTALAPMVVKPYLELIELMLHIRESIWKHEPLAKEYAYQLWQTTGSRYAHNLLYHRLD